MPVPGDPAAFIAEAARAVNDRDLEAAAGVYASDAALEALTDGTYESFQGADAIRRAWAGYLAAMAGRDFQLEKRLVAVSNETLVNEWSGSFGGRTDSRGIEYWVFDPAGKVREHRLYTFFNLKPTKHVLGRLRVAASYPVTGAAFLREQRKAERGAR